ncbi:MAG: hypothetical protein QW594_02770 [Candidatus Woesearchaeota archaeon]
MVKKRKKNKRKRGTTKGKKTKNQPSNATGGNAATMQLQRCRQEPG